jgi:2-aminoethylphosphonate-pyruvate transaminase
VVAALRAATDQFIEEGGQPARLARYRRNCEELVDGMRGLGIASFLDPAVQAPIIVTFHAPRDPAYAFPELYRRVRERGFILYPGKLTRVETFRVGCIGAIDHAVIRSAVAAVGEALDEMAVRDRSPRPA